MKVLALPGPPVSSAWARTPPARAVRSVLQTAGLAPLVHSQVSVDVHGAEHVRDLDGPALIVANHASHLDTAVLLTSLPRERRRRTAVAAAADYFFAGWPRATGSALVFNTFPIERRAGGRGADHDATGLDTPGRLLADGWSLVVYPEGTRSVDGYLGRFRMGAAWLAVQHQVPVLPVGLRGTYAAMPRGRRWPRPGRPRVSVRFGPPLRPAATDRPRDLAPRLVAAVRGLVEEDASTWWDTLRSDGPATPVPAAAWRRVWQQTAELPGPPRPRIWRD